MSEKNRLDTIAAEMKNQEVLEASAIINDISVNLNANNTNKKMPDSVFKEYFLPYFNGSEEINDDNPIIFKWIEFSGGIGKPVDIIDIDGNTVTTIPGLLDKDAIDRDVSNKIDYNKISSDYELKKNRSGVAGDAYAESMLGSVGKMIDTGKTNKDDLRNALNVLSTTIVNNEEVVVNDMSDTLDYD